MDHLLIAALLVANLGVFVFVCHLVVLVKKTLIHGGKQLELEERAEALQHALTKMASQLDQVTEEATNSLATRERRIVALATSCEQTVEDAQRLLGALQAETMQAERLIEQAEALRLAAREPEGERPAEPEASAASGGESTAIVAATGAPKAARRSSAGKPAAKDEQRARAAFEKRNAGVFALHAQGLTKERIAAKLCMSVGEVELALGVRQRLADGSAAEGAPGTE